MKIFIHVDDCPDIDAVAEPLLAAITAWVADCNCSAEPVDVQDEVHDSRTLGLRLDTSKKAILKPALDALQVLAQRYELDFAVGYLDDHGGAHKVCYFGHEEGRPDSAEIGSYLGLKR